MPAIFREHVAGNIAGMARSYSNQGLRLLRIALD